MSPSTATNRDLHSEAGAIAKRILDRKVTDHDATLVFELSNRLLRAEGDTVALQATASAARHACKLAEQQRDELLAARARTKLLPLERAPKDRDQYIRVYTYEVFRWLPYKPGSNEFKRGMKGRWQKHTGYGFDNAELAGIGYQPLDNDGNPVVTPMAAPARPMTLAEADEEDASYNYADGEGGGD